jgi:two-component system response regulator (stage 0 sporulation protein F)
MARILIIDDEPPIRTLLRLALESVGHEVVEAQDGRVGLTLYRQNPTDLIITDILLPELNGLDIILELVKEFLNVKVIAMSGGTERGNFLNTAKLLGARQTLQKPFSIEKLLSVVRYELAH